MWKLPILHFLLIGIRINSLVYSVQTSSRGGCVLPKNLVNSRFCSFDCDDCFSGKWIYEPGDTVKHLVRVQCEPGHELGSGKVEKVTLCLKGNWIPPIPHCYKVCPPLVADTVYVKCSDGNVPVNCSTSSVLPGTTASYKCKPFYMPPDVAGQSGGDLVCSSGGLWSGTLPKCVPECGKATEAPPAGEPGKPTKTSFPWHAGVYNRKNGNNEKWNYICGGTLISSRIVLTAAHCVVLHLDNSVVSASELRVALGKYYLSWDDPEQYSVKRRVSGITVADGYRGSSGQFALDLAYLVLGEQVPVNTFIMPVCLLLEESDFTSSVRSSTTGQVLTWLNPAESNVLSRYQVSLDSNTCRTQAEGPLLTSDKFCGVVEPGTGSKRFYSGAAVTAEINNRHYLLGLGSAEFKGIGLFSNTSGEELSQYVVKALRGV